MSIRLSTSSSTSMPRIRSIRVRADADECWCFQRIIESQEESAKTTRNRARSQVFARLVEAWA